jgi:hypothetical protein
MVKSDIQSSEQFKFSSSQIYYFFIFVKLGYKEIELRFCVLLEYIIIYV